MQIQPDFILYDQKGREAYMSQLGTFTPGERDTFHKLCRLWTPNLSYQTALSVLSADSPTAKADLHSLLAKLQRQRCGLIRTAITEGVRGPVYILLCSPDDPVFYLRLADEYLWDSVEDPTKPLPSSAVFSDHGVPLPPQAGTEATYADLARAAAESGSKDTAAKAEDDVLFLLPGKGELRYTVVLSSAKRYLTVAIAKFQSYFQNANLLSFVAQLKNTSLMDLRKSLTQKDPLFWHELAAFIIATGKELTANRKVAADAKMFEVALFVKDYLIEQMAEYKKKRELEIERATDMRTIVEKIRSAITLMVSEQDFAETLLYYKPKYGDDFQAFKDEFQKQFLEPPTGKNLPVVVRVSTAYVHMDNLNAYFLQNVSRLGADLLNYYIRLMEGYIKHPNMPGYEAFYSSDNLENHIQDQIKSMSLPMADLMDRPNLVAEAMIHAVRKQKDNKNPLEVRQILSGFFHADRIRFLPPSTVLGINISDIFRVAFLKAGIIRQIILKLTGKHESMARKFATFVQDSLYRVGDEEASTSSPRTRKAMDQGETRNPASRRSRNRDTAPGRRAAEYSRGPGGKTWVSAETKKALTTPKAPAPKPKAYSEHERNEAWETFSKSIKK